MKELDSVDEMVDDVEGVPEPDCEIDCVLQGDAVKETDAVPHALAEGDSDDRGEPDALSDQLFELHPDGEYELVNVGEIVGDVECVPDTDCDSDCVLHGDAVNEFDSVVEIVGDVESVPDTDCDTERVPQEDAVKEFE